MKVRLNLIALCFSISIAFFSCQKEISFNSTAPEILQDSYKKNVDDYLKNILSVNDYKQIDLERAKISMFDEGKSYFLRIPLVGKSIASDFIAIQTDTIGKCIKGNFIHYDMQYFTESNHKTIFIDNLQRNKSWKFTFSKNTQPIASGNITPNSASISRIIPTEIPVYQGGGVFFYPNLSFFLNPSGAVPMTGGGWGVPSSGLTPGGFGTYGYYFNNNVGTPTIQNSDKVEFEDNENEPAIDITKIFNCFNTIPDAGATYTVSLNSDIPVNSNPNRAMSIPSGSPGHSFITITKVNGGSSVTKSFGFYPVTGYKSITDPYGFTSSKIVNNSQHEINSSLTRFINQAQFNLIKNEAIVYSARLYSLAFSNCTDFALTTFNSAFSATEKVTLPSSVAFSPINPTVSIVIQNSPQMLFKHTKNLIPPGDEPPPPGVIISTAGNYKAANSPGECN